MLAIWYGMTCDDVFASSQMIYIYKIPKLALKIFNLNQQPIKIQIYWTFLNQSHLQPIKSHELLPILNWYKKLFQLMNDIWGSQPAFQNERSRHNGFWRTRWRVLKLLDVEYHFYQKIYLLGSIIVYGEAKY